MKMKGLIKRDIIENEPEINQDDMKNLIEEFPYYQDDDENEKTEENKN